MEYRGETSEVIMETLLAFFAAHSIPYQRFDHHAVFTVEESEKLPPMPGSSTKNLFLYDSKQNRYFLVSVNHDKRVDLKALTKLLEATKLSFGSAESMKQLLGVEPGSVTLFGVLHDIDRVVDVIIDREAWDIGALQCHPLINTATFVITTENMERFFHAIDHVYRILDVPAKN